MSEGTPVGPTFRSGVPRVALVCAASKGLGRASAEALARDGLRVAICARGREALAGTAAALEAAGGDVLALEDTFELDVFSPIRQDWLDHTDDYFHR